MLKVLSLAKTQLKEFQNTTGQHCCSSQHDEQIKTINITLFTEAKQKPWEYLCTCNLTWLKKQQPITTLLLRGFLAFPGEQSNELWCQSASQPLTAGLPLSPAGHEDIRHTARTSLPPCHTRIFLVWAVPRIWRKPTITARAVFKHLLSG